jgi:hypothetical protein
VIEDLGRFHNEELHNLYSSLNIIRVVMSRRIRLVRTVALMGEIGNAYKTFVGKSEGKRPFARPTLRWEDNTKRDLREVVVDDVDGFSLLRVGMDGVFCEHDKEP